MFEWRQPAADGAWRRSYDALYAFGWLGSRRGFNRWLLRHLPVLADRLVLDVGCGDGQLLEALDASGARAVGVDFSAAALRRGTKRRVQGDAAELPFPAAVFDAVICSGSLEHFNRLPDAVAEMARVSRPGAPVLILVPNAFGLTWNMHHVWRHGDLDVADGQPIQRFGTRKAWEQLLNDHGLRVEKTVGFERAWPGSWDEWRLYLRWPAEILLALLGPFVPLNLRRMFLFTCVSTQGSDQRSA